MVRDPECAVVGTFSGAMSVAKMGLLHLRDDRPGLAPGGHHHRGPGGPRLHRDPGPGALQVSRNTSRTGSSSSRAITASMTPWRWKPTWIMPKTCSASVLEKLDQDQVWSSAGLCRELGKYLAEHTDSPGHLAQRLSQGGAGLHPGLHRLGTGPGPGGLHGAPGPGGRAEDITAALGSLSLKFNPFLDLGAYAQKALAAKKLGIFTVGGGVPRNWAQQVAPYLELLHTPSEARSTGSAVSLRRADLPGAGPLGRLERLHLSGRGFLGEVRLAGGWRPLTPRSCATPPSPGRSSSKASANAWRNSR